MNGRDFFNATAWVYDFITDQDIWRDQIASVLNHVESLGDVEQVLDVGCGPGVSSFVLAQQLPFAEVKAIDLSENMIPRAKQHHATTFSGLGNLSFEVADATRLPFAAQSFDLAVGHSFLYLVPDQVAVLEDLRRVLKPGGCLVLMEPAKEGRIDRAVRAGWRGKEWRQRRPQESARFALSMILWRFFSMRFGQLSAERVQQLFEQAGFSQLRIVPTLGGLGMHCIATP